MVFLLTSGTGHHLLTWTEAGPSNCGIMSGIHGLCYGTINNIIIRRRKLAMRRRYLYTFTMCMVYINSCLFSLGGLISTSEVLVSLSINLAPTWLICIRALGVVVTSLRTYLNTSSSPGSLVVSSD